MEDQENLGPVEPWQIRTFPRALRLEIVEQAKKEGVPLSEFVTARWVALRDADWPRDLSGGIAPSGVTLGLLRETMQTIREIVETAAMVDQHVKIGVLTPRQAAGAKAVVRAALREVRRASPGSTPFNGLIPSNQAAISHDGGQLNGTKPLNEAAGP